MGAIVVAAAVAAVVAATVAAVAGPKRRAKADIQGGITMAAPGSSRPRATTTQAAGDGGRAGLGALLGTRAKGPSSASVPSQGGVSAVSRNTRFLS